MIKLKKRNYFIVKFSIILYLIFSFSCISVNATENNLSEEYVNNLIQDKNISNNVIKDGIDNYQNTSGNENNSKSHWSDKLIEENEILPNEKVTLQDFENKIYAKMFEVVSFLQTFTKPFCVLLFIICALGLLISIIFNTAKQKMYILGLIFTVITYVATIFAPDIILFLANWLSF